MINENDTTTTDEITFGDNDFLAAQVAILLGADAADAADRHRRPPHRRPAPSRRRRADPGGEALRGPRGARDRHVDVAARIGRDALEGGGRRDGDRGGDSRADPERHPSRGDRGGARRRRARARASIRRRGACRASSCGSSTRSPRAAGSRSTRGAEQALRERGTSLLPVGRRRTSTATSRRATPSRSARPTNGRAIGKGIVNYSADELRRIKGMKSAEVQELLPRASEEAVHRDYFVLG